MEKMVVIAKLRGILQAEFPLLADAELHADTPLMSSGILDSFATITLISAIEDAFNINIDVESIELSQLENLNTLADLCIKQVEICG